MIAFLSASALAGPADPLPEPGMLVDRDVRKKTGRIPALVRIIRLYDYSCDSISAFRKLKRARGYVLVCNNFSAGYEIQRYGEHWIVTRSRDI